MLESVAHRIGPWPIVTLYVLFGLLCGAVILRAACSLAQAKLPPLGRSAFIILLLLAGNLTVGYLYDFAGAELQPWIPFATAALMSTLLLSLAIPADPMTAFFILTFKCVLWLALYSVYFLFGVLAGIQPFF